MRNFFFAESLSSHKGVKTKWSSFFDPIPESDHANFLSDHFSPLKQSGGHFEFFVAESLSSYKGVETKWSSFFDLIPESALKFCGGGV